MAKVSTSRGVALLELVILAPLALLAAFIVLFLATFYNARSSLAQAVGTARLAFTRGQPQFIDTIGQFQTPINTLQRWHDSAGALEPWSSLEGLLFTANVDDPLGYHNSYSAQQFGNDIFNMPLHYVYAQTYVLQSMLQSVGAGAVRFPCDPHAADGAGCLHCINEAPTAGQDVSEWIAIRCEYRPDGSIIAPISGLLNLISGGNAGMWIIEDRYAPFS